MANKKKLFERQKELGDEIVNIREKLSQKTIRSSRLSEVAKRLDKIDAELTANNSKLLVSSITSEDYFEKNFYEALLHVQKEARLLIKEILLNEEQLNVAGTSQTSKESSKFEKIIATEANDELWEQFVETADWLNDWYEELSTNVAGMLNKND